MTAPIDWRARYEALTVLAQALAEDVLKPDFGPAVTRRLAEDLRAALAPPPGAEGREHRADGLQPRCLDCGVTLCARHVPTEALSVRVDLGQGKRCELRQREPPADEDA